jgi:DNA-binding HxlR family transcriptional regulator
MYEKKIPEDLECGIVVAMKVFGAKWKPCIIDGINRGFRRPSELHREISAATPRVIDMQLRELESFGILFKVVHTGLPLKVTYYLTELGESILPIIEKLNEWGFRNRHIMPQNNSLQAI